ncbi:hypothetical protein MPER_08299, partial [Moniliophthora perniciosa FA553]
ITVTEKDDPLELLRNLFIPDSFGWDPPPEERLSAKKRWYLELGAALDWVEVYQPLMKAGAAQTDRRTANVMGAFLYDSIHCELFASAGLPFWLVRPQVHHPSTRIDKQVVPLTAKGLHVNLDKFSVHPPKVIFSGAGSDKEKAIAMENYGRSIVAFVDPFAITDPQSPSSSSNISGAASRSQSRKPKKHSPYERPQQAAKPERDKFSEVGGQYSPAVPEVWVQALRSIDQSKRPPKEAVPNGGYAFPDPGLFLYAGLTSNERMLHSHISNQLLHLHLRMELGHQNNGVHF